MLTGYQTCKRTNNPMIRRSNVRTLRFAAFLIIFEMFVYAPPTYAAGPIVPDGQFSDWAGQPMVSDPQGDAQNNRTDIKVFYFTTNPDEETAYFMMERWEAGSQLTDYVLRVDTNNNGDYSETSDRVVSVVYKPSPSGAADITLSDGTGGIIRTIAVDAPWGEVSPGARVEWGVSFADLGISSNQTIRLQAFSMQRNSVSDETTEVQWSPADALGWLGVGSLALIGSIWLFYRKKTSINWNRS